MDALSTLFRLMIEPYRKYATFSGRAARREYWAYTAFQWLVIGAILGLGWVLSGGGDLPFVGPDNFKTADLITKATSVAIWVFVFANILPWLAVSTRRLHDRDYRGWIMFRWFLPYVGVLFMLWDLLRRGDKAENSFGPNPYAPNYDDWFE